MQGMIPHHAQALEMSVLVRRQSGSDAVRQMALRMEISQEDEIALMESWLRSHGESLRMQGMSEDRLMPGMLTSDQMEDLRSTRGLEFDRRFLEYMIQHHSGAVVMVRELFSSPGAGQESLIFKFAEDVEADQTMEIARMRRVLGQLGG
jgi:uncharacterized protein (DUF305 family)